MTPVILLTDGYIANGAEPWKLPDLETFEPFPAQFHTDPEGFFPFKRDPKTLARVWAKPGTPGLQHRIGGLEKNQHTGHISYDPDNHHAMVKLRAQKIANVADDVPEAALELGEPGGDVLVVGWGSTYGSIRQAVQHVQKKGAKVAHLHLRNIWPLPKGLDALMKTFDQVIVSELNDGQLLRLLRAELLTDAVGHQKIAGQPFRVSELVELIETHLPGGESPRASSAVA
jgi:2-oxoglutarate ferredoxin oxidoreductase subunit alpha